MNSYKTLFKFASAELIEKKSRFIGYARKAESEIEALNFINEIKAKHADATHNVYAYSLREQNTARFSDDGEPHGTAGLPVLEVLRKENIINAVVVVTRYFGGTLLGAGGLVRAYSAAAKLAVDAAGIAQMRMFHICRTTIEYSEHQKLMFELEKAGVLVTATDYTEKVTVEYAVLSSEFEKIADKISEITNGRSAVEKLGERYQPIITE